MKVTVTCGRKFHSDHLANALLQEDALERVVTANPRSAYRRYKFPSERIRFLPPVYLTGWVAGKLPPLRRLQQPLDWWATRTFDRMASRNFGQPDAIIAWAWSARRTFEVAKSQGIRCVLEECGSANAYQESLLAEEYDRLGLPRRVTTLREVIDNERRECELADRILCPSEYVARSFSIYGVPRERCIVIPYASNPTLFSGTRAKADGKFRILYVGSVSVRKGIIYLLKALALLPRDSFECTVIGQIDPDLGPLLQPYAHLFEHVSAVPHDRIAAYYQRASVFVLPTLDEGMAYVIMEALASGVPVITTPHSGAEDMIRDGENGFLVPIRNAEAVAEKISVLQSSPADVLAMSSSARTSAQEWTWANYVAKLLPALASI